jgi:hypothetical protein
MRAAFALVVAALVLLCAGAADTKRLKRDPSTGVIRLLYIGAPFKPGPYQVFKPDPLLSTTPVQADVYGGLDVVERSMRIFMPRTKDALITGYDLVGLDDANAGVFRPQSIQWLVDGCRDDGLGLFMGGGFESFGGAADFPSWGDTVLDQVLPVECTDRYGNDGRNVVTDHEDELIGSLPWEEYERHDVFAGYNIVSMKDGARQLSKVVAIGAFGTDPGWVWWDIGEGRFFASAPGLRGGSAGLSFIWWKHYPDFVGNMAYFAAGLTPPSDVELLHSARAGFQDCYYQKQVVLSTIAFISRYGADTGKVDEKLMEAETLIKAARGSYIELDLVRSRELADETLEILEEAYQLAIEAKNVALYWIFVSEWLVTSATGLICGVVVWALMVRRRLYREVGTTRGGRTGG